MTTPQPFSAFWGPGASVVGSMALGTQDRNGHAVSTVVMGDSIGTCTLASAAIGAGIDYAVVQKGTLALAQTSHIGDIAQHGTQLGNHTKALADSTRIALSPAPAVDKGKNGNQIS